jgi:hypothetical protein
MVGARQVEPVREPGPFPLVDGTALWVNAHALIPVRTDLAASPRQPLRHLVTSGSSFVGRGSRSARRSQNTSNNSSGSATAVAAPG